LRISTNDPDEEGYNSDYKSKDNVQFQEDFSWTEAFLLKDVPQVKVGDTIYREFQLDINQNSGGDDNFLTIDEVEVWTTATYMNDVKKNGPINTDRKYPFTDDEAAGYMQYVWNLDADDVSDGYDTDDDKVIMLNYECNPGSGKRDFKILIPDDYFKPYLKYVVLYAHHGADAYTGNLDDDGDPATTGDQTSVSDFVAPNNDGFEEWGVAKYPATKAGYKFNDLSADGVWDKPGETGIGGWEIRAYADTDEEGDPGYGKLDQDEYDALPVASTTTAGNGSYSFSLEPGRYIVVEVLQASWYQSPDGADTPGDSVLAAGLNTGTETLAPLGYAVDLGNGAYDVDNNFGNYQRGCLEVCKVLDTAAVIGPLSELPDGTFEITVTGPSYPTGYLME
jgi:hypothetical protein